MKPRNGGSLSLALQMTVFSPFAIKKQHQDRHPDISVTCDAGRTCFRFDMDLPRNGVPRRLRPSAGVLMDESSYGHRSWCRLERLCYVTCRPFTECKWPGTKVNSKAPAHTLAKQIEETNMINNMK